MVVLKLAIFFGVILQFFGGSGSAATLKLELKALGGRFVSAGPWRLKLMNVLFWGAVSSSNAVLRFCIQC